MTQLDSELVTKIAEWFGKHNINSHIELDRDYMYLFCKTCNVSKTIPVQEVTTNATVLTLREVKQ
jgi:hypothetical protein